MNKIKKIGIVAVLALALTLSSAAPAIAGLTLDTTSVVSGGALTLNGAATSAITLGGTQTTGTMSIATGNGDQTIDVGTGTGAKAVNIGTNATGIKTIKIGDNASPANVITIGGAASSTTVKGTLTVGVDNTGHDVQLFGATALSHLLWDESDDALELNGDARIDLSLATVKAANTDGGVVKIGASGSPVVEDTADMKFMSFYFDNGATSGDNRGIYNRLNLTGAGGGGESLRSYTEIEGVAASTAHGAHISLGMGESTTKGSVTGLGVGVRSTLGLPDGTLASGGTYAAMMPEIYSFGAGGLGDVSAVTELSFIRPVNGGHATGRASVDDKAFLLALDTGFTDGTGNMLYDPTLKIKAGANTRYLIMSEAEGKLDLGDSSQGIDIGNATTGIALTGAQTTGISIAATSLTDAIKISATTPADGLEISSAATANAINISGASVVGIDLNDSITTTGIDIGSVPTGISFTGDYTTAAIQVGTTGAGAIALTADDHAVDIWTTNSLTSGTVRSVDITQTHTGATGSIAEALTATLDVENVALGSWGNAIFGKIDFSTTGSVAGQAGVICSELTMPGGTIGSAGTYATYQAEINCPANYASGGVPINVFDINSWGDEKAQFDTTGYLFDISGVTPTDSQAKMITNSTHADISGTGEIGIRVKVDGVAYYLMAVPVTEWD